VATASVRTEHARGPGSRLTGVEPEKASAAVLRVRTIGKCELRIGEQPIAILGRKSRALIGYLALSDTFQESRERTVGLLWSESAEEHARASLRQAVHELREAFQRAGFSGFTAEKLTLALDRARIQVDIADALAAAKQGAAHPALLEGPHPIADILGELESCDPAFQTWLAAKRQTIHDQLVRHLEVALRTQPVQSDKTRELATALINLDPTHEEACRCMIRLLAAEGEIGAALKIYKSLWDLLSEEYDVEPTQQTQDLIVEIKSALPLADSSSSPAPLHLRPERLQAAAGAGAKSTDPRLAAARDPKLMLSVGPFKLMSAEHKQDYVAQGFRRELIASLVRFREWSVRDWTESGRTDAGGTQNLEFLLDASGYQTNDGIHFVLTLRDGTTDNYLWSEGLTLSLANWHQAQQSMVRRIANTLNVHVSAERLNFITARESADLKAYDVWLLGQETLLSLDPERWDRAQELFRQVVERNPKFAPAHSSLAQLNNSYHIVKPGTPREVSRTDEALSYAREAVRLDPVDSRSHLCLGWSHAMAKQYEQAMIYIPLACGLNDTDRWTLVSSANCFAFCGRYEQAYELIDTALPNLRLAPTPLEWAYQSAVHFMAGNYERCVAAAEAAGDLNSNVRGFKAAALWHLGRKDAAAGELQRFFSIVGTRWRASAPATPEAITRWFLSMFPIASTDDWTRLRDGIAGAGAPVGGLAHHEW
jgi:DNA-binding SARP family transcriptional activator